MVGFTESENPRMKRSPKWSWDRRTGIQYTDKIIGIATGQSLEAPYVVVAFRGTEKKVDDWLTDAKAVPTEDGDTKVHSGFLEALKVETDSLGRSVLKCI